MKATIYAISFWPLEKYYIGVTENLERRKADHLYHLNNGSHICRELQAAFDEFGADEIEFSTELICDWPERLACEKQVARRYGEERLFNSRLLRSK